MTFKVIIRGDSYQIRRPLFVITVVNELGAPFDLAGCTVRTTYKTVMTDPTLDATDSEAAIKHHITINASGAVTAFNGLYLAGAAATGVLHERLSSAESRVLPLDTPLYSDVEVTDANGEIFTWIMTDYLATQDGYTNRTTG